MGRICLALFLLLTLLLPFSFPCSQVFSQETMNLSDLPPGRAAARLLFSFQQEGCLRLRLAYPNPILYVEPRFWQNLAHIEKVNFGKLALELVNALKDETGYHCSWIYIKNMTTKETFGTVHLPDSRVEIFK